MFIDGYADIDYLQHLREKIQNKVGSTEVEVSAKLVNKAEAKLVKEIKDLVIKTINRMQEKNVEPWLIGHRLWAKDPDFFETVNWDETGWKEI